MREPITSRPGPPSTSPVSVEARIARLLFAGTLFGVGLLLVGVALMLATGVDPTGGGYLPFDASRLAADLTSFRAEGFLWAGIVVLVATPVARTVGELIAFGLRRDLPMALVALAILGIIASSIVLTIGTEG